MLHNISIIILIVLIIIQFLYNPSFDINKQTGDLILWIDYKKSRKYIILIHNFKKQ
jgi:hypothetical protein